MLDKTERLMAELRIVTDGLAHDLRSPLARLRAKTEAAVLSADPAQREAAMGGLLIETDLVMRMLSTMIEITRAEFGAARSLHPRRARRADGGDRRTLCARGRGCGDAVLRPSIAAYPPRIVLHRELLTQALANLIDNALHHARGGRGSYVAAGDRRGRGRASRSRIAAPASPKPTARRRYAASAGSTARELTPGAGLGMALVEAVARLHGGRIELGDNAPGLVAAIVVPATL